MADIPVLGEAPVSQADPVEKFSFDSVHEKAMAYGSDTPSAADAAVEQVAEPVVETPAADAAVEESTNIDSASASQLAQLKDTDLVEVTVDGENVQMTWKDARNGVQRQSHYTKSMQQLRQEQAEFEAQRAPLQKAQEEHAVLVELLRSPDLMKDFIARQYPQLLQSAQQIQAAAEQVDPNDIATVGQIQAAAQQQQAQMQALQEQFMQNLATREEALTRTIEDRQAVAKLSGEINTTIGGLFGEHPYMQKLIPNAEQVLRYEVSQLRPNTPEETVEAFKTVFGGWVENYKASVAETTKSTVIAKKTLANNNIQPPGGAAPQPTPTSFKKVNKMTGKPEVDWDAIRAVSIGMLGKK